MSNEHAVASSSEIGPGQKKVLMVDGRPIAIFNVGGQFHALDDVCTHDGGPLAEGEFQGCEIQCPRHGARFDVRTGKALSFPAFSPVPTHGVAVRDGRIFVTLTD